MSGSKELTAEAAEDRGGLQMRDINRVGLLINFNVLRLKDGLKRIVNKLEPSASSAVKPTTDSHGQIALSGSHKRFP